MAEIFRLCYVSGNCAYFTTQDIDKQWGDDWDDAPYEHNAESPYEWREGKDRKWKIARRYYEGDFELPCTHVSLNSDYSVEMINRGAVPWIQTDRFSPRPTRTRLYAGATLDEFLDQIRLGGGVVYAPLWDDEE